MAVKEGDLLLGMYGADRVLVGLPVTTAQKEDDLVYPARCADGETAAVKVVTMQKEDDIGIVARTADDELAGIQVQAPAFWYALPLDAYGRAVLQYEYNLLTDYDDVNRIGVLVCMGRTEYVDGIRLQRYNMGVIAELYDITSMGDPAYISYFSCPRIRYGQTFYLRMGADSTQAFVANFDSEGTQNFEVLRTFTNPAYPTFPDAHYVRRSDNLGIAKEWDVDHWHYYLVIVVTAGVYKDWGAPGPPDLKYGNMVMRYVFDGDDGQLVGRTELAVGQSPTSSWPSSDTQIPATEGNWWILKTDNDYNVANKAITGIWRGCYSRTGTFEAYHLYLSRDTADLIIRGMKAWRCGDYVVFSFTGIPWGGGDYKHYFYKFHAETGAGLTKIGEFTHGTADLNFNRMQASGAGGLVYATKPLAVEGFYHLALDGTRTDLGDDYRPIGNWGENQGLLVQNPWPAWPGRLSYIDLDTQKITRA